MVVPQQSKLQNGISETYDEKGIKYTTGTATADDLQTSYQMARFAAQEELASFINGQMNGLTKEAKTIIKVVKLQVIVLIALLNQFLVLIFLVPPLQKNLIQQKVICITAYVLA